MPIKKDRMSNISPYRVVAKKALMSWNGLSEEEAANVVKNSSFEELENQCWASGSMQYAIDYLANRLNLTDEEKTDFANAVFGKDKVYLDGFDRETLKDIGKKLETTNRHQVVVETLSAIHDGWVKDNAKKFNQVLRDDKRYQHLPIELIGWEEASLDMLFLQPILESTEIKFSKKETIQAYNQSVKDFFEKNDLQSTDDLAKLIEKGPDFYSPLTEKNSVKDMFMFNEKTMDYLKRHKGDKRLKNLSYPDITEKDKFVEEVQSIVNQLHEEDCEMAAKQAVLNGNDPRSVNEYMQTLKPLKVETIDVTKEELAEVIAEQAVEKLPINENIKEDLFGGDEE
ncbi:MAG TPA: hypothetical protein DCO89_01575 [Clostridiales bacterium]|nr:hypothetical protein [Clostridiales bacterium]